MWFKKFIALLTLFVLVSMPAIYAEAAGKPVVAIIPFSDQSARKGSPESRAAIEENIRIVSE